MGELSREKDTHAPAESTGCETILCKDVPLARLAFLKTFEKRDVGDVRSSGEEWLVLPNT